MDREILSLRPTEYLCPTCGEWHPWDSGARLEYFVSENRRFTKTCPYTPYNMDDQHFTGFFREGNFYFSVSNPCNIVSHQLNGCIPISEIIEKLDEPVATFNVWYENSSRVSERNCMRCLFTEKCISYKQYLNTMNGGNSIIQFGFKFDRKEYAQACTSLSGYMQRTAKLEQEAADLSVEKARLHAVSQALREESDQLVAEKNQFQTEKNEFYAMKEATKMSENKTVTTPAKGTQKNSLLSQLYEHSPKENVELVKAWANKYHGVMSWAIPVVTVYAAYHILDKSKCDLNVNNISEKFEEKLGFRLEMLDDHRKLKELLTIGGVASLAYTAVKGVSTILNTQETKDISIEDVESGMDKLQAASNRFSWIQPKVEDLLPIACSVIMVYVSLHKPKFTGPIMSKIQDFSEDLKIRIDVYWDWTKAFLSSKLGLDLNNEKDQCKLRFTILLTAILGIAGFLYGKKVLTAKASTEANDKKVNESITKFVDQAKSILEKIAPTLYTTLLTFLASKMILREEKATLPAADAVIIDAEGGSGDGTPPTDPPEVQTE